MHFTFWEYPPVWILFALSAIGALLSKKYDLPAAVAAGTCGIGGILTALIFGVPMEEILLLLLIPLLCAMGKGVEK